MTDKPVLDRQALLQQIEHRQVKVRGARRGGTCLRVGRLDQSPEPLAEPLFSEMLQSSFLPGALQKRVRSFHEPRAGGVAGAPPHASILQRSAGEDRSIIPKAVIPWSR